MSGMTVTVEGLQGLLSALEELPKRVTQKAVVKRALTLSAEPIRELASALAPYADEGKHWHLRSDIIVSDKTTARDGDPGAPPGSVTVFIGPNKLSYQHHGIFMEFGTFKDRAQPFMRPAFEGRKDQSVNLLGYYMWVQIDATAQRLAARAAKLAGA